MRRVGQYNRLVMSERNARRAPWPGTDRQDAEAPGSVRRGRSAPLRIVTALALAGALALAVLLAVRPLISPDLGYHLAYGEEFLEIGRIVDTNSEFLYTLPADADYGGQMGPGCWYDADGRYRFANANWLSQVVMAAVHRLGGANGLCALQAALVAAIFALLALTMRRLAVPAPLAAGGLLLVAVAAHMRFTLRPEVFGYLVLAAQMFVLAGDRPTWGGAALLIALQMMLVNLHGYFLLGPALSGAFLAGEAARLLPGRRAAADAADTARRARRLAAAMLGQLLVSFVNPWTWRLAVLPIQTLVFLRVNHIAGADLGSGGHPWSYIGEFFRPFAGPFLTTKATLAYCVLLALAGAGGVAAIVRRRWAWLLIIGGMAAVSLTMRRNIAPAAILIAPTALASCCHALRGVWKKWRTALRVKLSAAVSLAVMVLAAVLGMMVVTQRFYFRDRSPVRFGWGLSRLHLPLGAAAWLGQHRDAGRLWTDYTSSSNLHYFTAGRPDVPIVTNTWAYPPDVMRQVVEINAGRREFSAVVEKYGISTVATRVDRTTAPLVRKLADDDGWALVSLDARHVVFRKIAAASPRAANDAISEQTLDWRAYRAKLRSTDPVAGFALHLGGLTLYHLGWDSAAAETFAAATREEPAYHEAWLMRGVCLARRGTRRMTQTGNRDDLLEAAKCFGKALELRPDYAPARRNLEILRRRLR